METISQCRAWSVEIIQVHSKPLIDSFVDTMKLYTKAHGAKVCQLFLWVEHRLPGTVQTSNLIINLEHDDWILDDDSRTLADLSFGVCKYSKTNIFITLIMV